MKKSWIFTGLIVLMILTMGWLFFWKNYYHIPLKSNKSDIKATLLEKTKALFSSEDEDFLAKNLEEKNVVALSDELSRILVAQNISKSDLTEAKQKELVESQEKIDLATQKLAIQLHLNKMFLNEDYRQAENKASSVDVEKVFEEEAESSVEASSQPTEESSGARKLKDISEKVSKNEVTAINGTEHNAFLIISDTLVQNDLDAFNQLFEANFETGLWHQTMATIFKNAEEQLTTYETAKTKVMGLFDGTDVRFDITKDEFQEVLGQVEKIYSPKRQEELMEQMEKVAEAIGAELLNRDFIFENLSDKDGVTFEAKQTNADWWTGPISLSVTVKNDTSKNISFSYGRLAILKSTNTFHPSQYPLRSDSDRFVVKKGESFTLDALQFKFPTEALVSGSRGSQLAYLLDKEEVSTPTTIIIANVLFNQKPTTTSSSEKPEETVPSLDVAAIQKIREKLLDLDVTANSITDVDMQALIDQAATDNLDETGLIKLICDYLQLDYQQVMADAEAKIKDTSSGT